MPGGVCDSGLYCYVPVVRVTSIVRTLLIPFVYFISRRQNNTFAEIGGKQIYAKAKKARVNNAFWQELTILLHQENVFTYRFLMSQPFCAKQNF